MTYWYSPADSLVLGAWYEEENYDCVDILFRTDVLSGRRTHSFDVVADDCFPAVASPPLATARARGRFGPHRPYCESRRR